MPELLNNLIAAGVDAKTAALIWFAIVYNKRLTALEALIKSMKVCKSSD